MQNKFEDWIVWVKEGLRLGLITSANIKITMKDTNIEIEEAIAVDTAVKDLTEPNKAIVVYNDDVNDFLHVISCFMMYCDHGKEQAEQCALIIHNNGKCAVKGGTYDKLKPICEVLLEKHLTAKIE